MRVISVDVGWKRGTKRNAVAIATPPRQIEFLASGLRDDDLIELVRKWAGHESLVLLDVPIEGCENLREPRRPLEKVLQHYMSLYPSSRAGLRGVELKQSFLHTLPESIIVQEIYPHAVYKFLWVAKQKDKLGIVQSRRWEEILDESFTPRNTPPKYKDKVGHAQRLEGMRELYYLLARDLGLHFAYKLGFPEGHLGRSRLDLLADEYDACLGAVVGLHSATNNPYAWVAGDRLQGELLLLADRWLKEQLEMRGIGTRRLR